MINEIENKLIQQLQSEEDLETCVNVASASRNPLFLKEYAIAYNWDDGYAVPNAIADNEHCDVGTALILFWLSESMAYYLGESQRNEYNNEWAKFCEKITERLISGYYKHGLVSFKPAEFNINRVSEYKYKKLSVPAVLYKEVIGTQ